MVQIFVDWLEISEDFVVCCVVFKLVNLISCVVNLCEIMLVFGKVEELVLLLLCFNLLVLVVEVIEVEVLVVESVDGNVFIEFFSDVFVGLMICVDCDQLFCVLLNLLCNVWQVIEVICQFGIIEIGVGEDEQEWFICVGDIGSGLLKKVCDFLFQFFLGGLCKGGIGFGLVIVVDLVCNYGGCLELLCSDEEGM